MILILKLQVSTYKYTGLLYDIQEKIDVMKQKDHPKRKEGKKALVSEAKARGTRTGTKTAQDRICKRTNGVDRVHNRRMIPVSTASAASSSTAGVPAERACIRVRTEAAARRGGQILIRVI